MSAKSLLKKLLGYKEERYNSLHTYTAAGNLVHGTNCKLEGLNISIPNSRNNHINITIGNDCYLSCNILLQTSDAEIIIGDGVFIGPGTTLFCHDKIVFGNDIMVSWGCTFIDTNAHSLDSQERGSDVRDWLRGPEHKNWSVVKHSPIYVNSKSWIGFNSIINKGVTVEEGSVVGCGSVVTKSTEKYSVYAGNPAVFIKKTT